MTYLDVAIVCGKIALVLGLLLNTVPILVWIERKGSAYIQDRPGPNRVGPFGLLQPLADVVKFIFKEDPTPFHAHQILFPLAPIFSLVPAAIAFAAIPFGDTVDLFGRTIVMQVADINIGILYVVAVGSLGVYGILIAGWSSNNKFSMLGALRASAQTISYEIALGASLIGPLLIYGTFSLREMVYLQSDMWGIVIQPLSFIIFFIAAFAECNRLPFDLPEGEAELVGGFHTEFGSMKFAMFFMAEYLHMVTISALAVTLFFGGWQIIPGMISISEWVGINTFPKSLGLSFIQFLSFAIKTSALALFFVWARWTLPRFRYDQLMSFGWKILIPLALLNIVLTTLALYLGWI